MKQEYDERQESVRQRNIKVAKFPYIKIFDDLDHPRVEHVDAAYLKELAPYRPQYQEAIEI